MSEWSNSIESHIRTLEVRCMDLERRLAEHVRKLNAHEKPIKVPKWAQEDD